MLVRITGLLGLVLLLFGCSTQQVQRDLDERDANEIQRVLTDAGISCGKVFQDGKRPTWSIEVSKDQAADAIGLLAQLGLPRAQSSGFKEVFSKGSLVPTPTEERAMFLEALSGELSRTLESVEGVLSARVHLVLPPPSRPGVAAVPGKASAFLKVRASALPRLNGGKEDLRALVAGGVEGLVPADVTIVFNEVTLPDHFVKPEPKRAFPGLRWVIASLGFVICASALSVVGATLLAQRKKLPVRAGT